MTDTFGGAVSVTNARRLAGIFDENMVGGVRGEWGAYWCLTHRQVGYVAYEKLLDKIRQQV